MDDVIVLAKAAVAGHPAVIGVEFAGSRSRGMHTEHSDWDFAVQTDDFDALARDLPALVETLDPLAAQWEPLGDFPVYMVLVPGPTKIEYLFLDRSQTARPPVTPGADTLVAIDAHFWDWVWWLATKASVGRSDLVAGHMPQLHAHILGPIGADAVPADLGAAIAEYLSRRAELERRFEVEVPRRLGDNVEAGIRRIMS
jgi:predicted nucleotidyltransferase